MHYEKYYALNWTWRYRNSTYCHSEYKIFDTQEEMDSFVLNILRNDDIEIVWCKKSFEEIWEKKNKP